MEMGYILKNKFKIKANPKGKHFSGKKNKNRRTIPFIITKTGPIFSF
jgi:hypothetical protein